MTIQPTAAKTRTTRRLVRVLAATAAIAGAAVLTAAPASAAQTCTGQSDSNLCLAINGVGGGNYAVHVGIDVHMSRAEAQEYIDDPGDPLSVLIRSDEGENLFFLPLTSLGATDGFGLGADFDLTVPGSWLNEDNGQDEIVAIVTLTDTDTNTVTKTFRSNQLVGNWP